jgi:hypothetical protein
VTTRDTPAAPAPIEGANRDALAALIKRAEARLAAKRAADAIPRREIAA